MRGSHGARLPLREDAQWDRVFKAAPTRFETDLLPARLPSEDFSDQPIASWFPPLHGSLAGQLTLRGEAQMYELGFAVGSAAKQANTTLSPADVYARTTALHRTAHSARAFLAGLAAAQRLPQLADVPLHSRPSDVEYLYPNRKFVGGAGRHPVAVRTALNDRPEVLAARLRVAHALREVSRPDDPEELLFLFDLAVQLLAEEAVDRSTLRDGDLELLERGAIAEYLAACAKTADLPEDQGVDAVLAAAAPLLHELAMRLEQLRLAVMNEATPDARSAASSPIDAAREALHAAMQDDAAFPGAVATANAAASHSASDSGSASTVADVKPPKLLVYACHDSTLIALTNALQPRDTDMASRWPPLASSIRVEVFVRDDAPPPPAERSEAKVDASRVVAASPSSSTSFSSSSGGAWGLSPRGHPWASERDSVRHAPRSVAIDRMSLLEGVAPSVGLTPAEAQRRASRELARVAAAGGDVAGAEREIWAVLGPFVRDPTAENDRMASAVRAAERQQRAVEEARVRSAVQLSASRASTTTGTVDRESSSTLAAVHLAADALARLEAEQARSTAQRLHQERQAATLAARLEAAVREIMVLATTASSRLISVHLDGRTLAAQEQEELRETLSAQLAEQRSSSARAVVSLFRALQASSEALQLLAQRATNEQLEWALAAAKLVESLETSRTEAAFAVQKAWVGGVMQGLNKALDHAERVAYARELREAVKSAELLASLEREEERVMQARRALRASDEVRSRLVSALDAAASAARVADAHYAASSKSDEEVRDAQLAEALARLTLVSDGQRDALARCQLLEVRLAEATRLASQADEQVAFVAQLWAHDQVQAEAALQVAERRLTSEHERIIVCHAADLGDALVALEAQDESMALVRRRLAKVERDAREAAAATKDLLGAQAAVAEIQYAASAAALNRARSEAAHNRALASELQGRLHEMSSALSHATSEAHEASASKDYSELLAASGQASLLATLDEAARVSRKAQADLRAAAASHAAELARNAAETCESQLALAAWRLEAQALTAAERVARERAAVAEERADALAGALHRCAADLLASRASAAQSEHNAAIAAERGTLVGALDAARLLDTAESAQRSAASARVAADRAAQLALSLSMSASADVEALSARLRDAEAEIAERAKLVDEAQARALAAQCRVDELQGCVDSLGARLVDEREFADSVVRSEQAFREQATLRAGADAARLLDSLDVATAQLRDARTSAQRAAKESRSRLESSEARCADIEARLRVAEAQQTHLAALTVASREGEAEAARRVEQLRSVLSDLQAAVVAEGRMRQREGLLHARDEAQLLLRLEAATARVSELERDGALARARAVSQSASEQEALRLAADLQSRLTAAEARITQLSSELSASQATSESHRRSLDFAQLALDASSAALHRERAAHAITRGQAEDAARIRAQTLATVVESAVRADLRAAEATELLKVADQAAALRELEAAAAMRAVAESAAARDAAWASQLSAAQAEHRARESAAAKAIAAAQEAAASRERAALEAMHAAEAAATARETAARKAVEEAQAVAAAREGTTRELLDVLRASNAASSLAEKEVRASRSEQPSQPVTQVPTSETADTVPTRYVAVAPLGASIPRSVQVPANSSDSVFIRVTRNDVPLKLCDAGEVCSLDEVQAILARHMGSLRAALRHAATSKDSVADGVVIVAEDSKQTRN